MRTHLTSASTPLHAQLNDVPDSPGQAVPMGDPNAEARGAADEQPDRAFSAERAETVNGAVQAAHLDEEVASLPPPVANESFDFTNLDGERGLPGSESEETRRDAREAVASSVEDCPAPTTPADPVCKRAVKPQHAPRRRVPKLAECVTYVPGPALEPVLRDLNPVDGGAGRVLIGPWATQPHRKATYLYTNSLLLRKAKDVPLGSKAAVERTLRAGLSLGLDHLIEAGRIVRDLPDLRLGAPVRGARDIVVLQPQEHAETWRLARVVRGMAAPGARVVLIGYESFSVCPEVDAIVHPLLRGLLRLTTRAQRHYYTRFRAFPLPLQDDPGFDHSKQRFGEVVWTFNELVAHLDSLPSMKRLKGGQAQQSGGLRQPFDELRALAQTERLKKAWGASTKKRKVSFPLIVRAGFLPN